MGRAMDTYRIYEKLSTSLGEKAAGELAGLLGDMYAELRNSVTKEDFRELKAVVAELAEAQRRTEKKVEELAEAQRRTVVRMEVGFKDIHNRFGVLGARWGDGAEAAFRAGLLEVVRGLGYRVEHFHGQDTEGFIDHEPRSYDLDVLVLNGVTVAAEIKSSANGPDVTEFARSVALFERQTGRKVAKRIIVAVTIRDEAREKAGRHGVIVATDFSVLESGA